MIERTNAVSDVSPKTDEPQSPTAAGQSRTKAPLPPPAGAQPDGTAGTNGVATEEQLWVAHAMIADLLGRLDRSRAYILRTESGVWRRTVRYGAELLRRLGRALSLKWRGRKRAMPSPHPFRLYLFARILMAKVFKNLYLIFEPHPVQIVVKAESGACLPVPSWLEYSISSDETNTRRCLQLLRLTPPISVIMPVYDPPADVLEEAIASVRRQSYPYWELCIADDGSRGAHVRRILTRHAEEDPRVRLTFRSETGGAAACSNSAAGLATGEFLFLMDHDDAIPEDAFYHVAALVNLHPDADLIYADEDKLDPDGRHVDAHYKPDWCPDNLLSRNYINHPTVLRRSLFEELGGFRPEHEAAEDYDLVLRAVERTRRIHHIPRILYHWRMIPGSLAGDAFAKPHTRQAAVVALEDALRRRGEPGFVTCTFPGTYLVRYAIRERRKVSVIIPAKDKGEVLNTCLTSIFAKTTYPNYEIIVVNNDSTEREFFETIERWQKAGKPIVRHDLAGPFNFSAIINRGVARSDGHFVLLLNNDTAVITPDWLEAMIEQAQRPSIGAVGVKLLYPNETVQHAGVIVGLHGAAGHSFVGYPANAPGYFNYIGSISNYSAVTAACMMFRRSAFDQAGGFDENLAIEFGDTDFCLRLRQAGMNNVYLPHVALYHYESLSRCDPTGDDESLRRHVSEVECFRKRWVRYVQHDPCYNPNLRKDAPDFRAP